MAEKALEHIEVLGYFKESRVINEEYNDKLLYFVAYKNSYNSQLDPREWIEGYNVIDGHFTLRDKNYLISCQEITKEEYMTATKGWYTPNEYL
jgi:hypothetical protein